MTGLWRSQIQLLRDRQFLVFDIFHEGLYCKPELEYSSVPRRQSCGCGVASLADFVFVYRVHEPVSWVSMASFKHLGNTYLYCTLQILFLFSSLHHHKTCTGDHLGDKENKRTSAELTLCNFYALQDPQEN